VDNHVSILIVAVKQIFSVIRQYLF
jgi:hypothetical protein